ncbi:MAG: hypothetical protein H6665_16475 [Ardenticatenaceae bacterium]|nr:hypothetical protein [Ardenticatenaceae bacterium]
MKQKNNATTVPFVDRPPTDLEVERFRLILSTYQDGSGMLERGTLPGWRDFERSVAAAFNGLTSESKFIYDVLIPVPDKEHTQFYGIDCKMRQTLNLVDSKGYVTVEISNASSEFWDVVKKHGITQEDYDKYPLRVAEAILTCIESWHEAESINSGGDLIIEQSCYLILQWSRKSGEYQLFQYPALLPKPEFLEWKVDGRRLIGIHNKHVLIEWYGLSGGQLKYYPLEKDAVWISQRFKLEPLPIDLESGLSSKAASYFPEAWERTKNPGF